MSDAHLALDATHAGPVVYCSWEDERDEAGRRIANFGAEIRRNEDQSLSIVKHGKTCYTIPTDQSPLFPRSAMF